MIQLRAVRTRPRLGPSAPRPARPGRSSPGVARGGAGARRLLAGTRSPRALAHSRASSRPPPPPRAGAPTSRRTTSPPRRPPPARPPGSPASDTASGIGVGARHAAPPTARRRPPPAAPPTARRPARPSAPPMDRPRPSSALLRPLGRHPGRCSGYVVSRLWEPPARRPTRLHLCPQVSWAPRGDSRQDEETCPGAPLLPTTARLGLVALLPETQVPGWSGAQALSPIRALGRPHGSKGFAKGVKLEFALRRRCPRR